MSRVGNIFELLSDENDEGGVRQASVVHKEAPASSKQEQKPKAPQQKGQQQKTDRQADNKARDNRPQRNNERRQPPREQGAGEVEKTRTRPPRQPREGAERRNKNLERAEGTDQEPRKRVFDRRSGTGRGPRDNIKRGGGGKGNWGTVEDDAKAQTEPVEKEGETQEKQQPTEQKEGEAKPAEQTEEKEEEDNTKTLEEYRKSIKAPSLSLPPPRQVQTTSKEWANFVPLNREPETTQQAKDKKKVEQEEKEAAEKKISADQIINFAEPPKPSFRGGRGGKRETGGRREGGGRGKKTKAPAPNFKDEKSFPSLGGATKA